MQYRKGYKYQLANDEEFSTSFRLAETIYTPRIILYSNGKLVVREAYAWDGTSGPVIDRKTNMRGSCAHDALYQLMRMQLIPYKLWRMADKDFAKWIKEDGAWEITIKVDLIGLRLARGKAALPKNRKKLYEV